jgi:hypothetical protein
VPPVLASARELVNRPAGGVLAALTVQAVLWAAVTVAGYARLRRTRP